MSETPRFHTEAAWEWFYEFVDEDPATGEEAPRAEWPYDELVIIYSLPSGQEVARASLAAGTLAVVDNAKRRVSVSIPATDRSLPNINSLVLLTAEGFGRKAGGEWKSLGEQVAYLRKGPKP